jgi:Rps23 Pro-64 3,4-dihydroxylase Tpa1-like proline 4-hydroxylase
VKSAARPPFRPRFLLNPFYLLRRLREMRSLGEFRFAFANVFVLAGGILRNAFYELRGLPALLAARAHRLRHVPRPAARSFAPAGPAPAGSSFEAREPLSLLAPAALAGLESLARNFQTAKPFKHAVVDGLLDPEFCRALAAEFPPYETARFRNTNGDPGKAEHPDMSKLGASYRKLDELFRSPEFLRFAGAVTGIPDLLYDPDYVGGGAHENLEDMELDPHVDFTVRPGNGLYRRVNLLLYLNAEWDESWGGGLELHVNPWLPDDKNPIVTISPVFNRCILFETSDHSWHGFRAIRLPPDRKGLTRRSFALYLYTRVKPRDFAIIPADLTVFVDRPLPPEFRSGRTLSEQDARVLRSAVVRRDWKLRHLYDRALTLYHEWRVSEERLAEAREALKRSEAEKAALANDLRLCRSQLLECLKTAVWAEDEKTAPRPSLDTPTPGG